MITQRPLHSALCTLRLIKKAVDLLSNRNENDSRSNTILLPKVDVVFKMLFGDVRNKDILIDLLKSILDLPNNEYENISIADPHLILIPYRMTLKTQAKHR